MENDVIDELFSETLAALKAAVREALSGATFEELVALRGNGHSKTVKKYGAASKRASSGGKRVRRSEEEIQAQAAKIPAILRKYKDGAGAEQICEDLGVERKDVPRLIAEALGQKIISKRGEKRGTLYFVGAAQKTVGAKSVRKASKKAAPKKADKAKKASKNSAAPMKTNSVSSATSDDALDESDDALDA